VANPFRKERKFVGEFLAEWSIRIVASLSIVIIFLIFFFVFREAASVFTAMKDSNQSSEQYTGSADIPAGVTAEQYSPESYGDSEVEDEQATLEDSDPLPGSNILTPINTNYPEIYNPETGSIPDDVNVPAGATSADLTDNSPALWENLSSNVWQPVGEQPKFGMIPLLIGTTKTTIIAILIGAPLGILAAIFTAFFAPARVRNIVKPAIELLAGFPSVVVGFFCLVTVASFIQANFDNTFRLNALVGGIGLALAVIPIVYAIAEDSLSAVPRSLWEASLALGSTKWQTAYRVMLPAAAPGVFAAVLLGIGRAFGETMIAIMATGNAALSDWSAMAPARTFAATIGSEMGEVVWGSEHYGVLFLLGTILFVVSFSLNAITELYVKKRLIKRFQGR
jgi:phosphate transport system permease protein